MVPDLLFHLYSRDPPHQVPGDPPGSWVPDWQAFGGMWCAATEGTLLSHLIQLKYAMNYWFQKRFKGRDTESPGKRPPSPLLPPQLSTQPPIPITLPSLSLSPRVTGRLSPVKCDTPNIQFLDFLISCIFFFKTKLVWTLFCSLCLLHH